MTESTSADDQAADATCDADGLFDDARFAAEGTRSAARWMTAAFAGIPSLAIVTTLIKGPGDAGYDNLLLGLGIAAAAVGALVGILAFAEVFAPVGLTDARLRQFKMARVAGVPTDIKSYRDLLTAIEDADRALSAATDAWNNAQPLAEAASAAAEALEKRAEAAEELAAATGATDETKSQARAARTEANEARIQATEATWDAARAKRDVKTKGAYLDRYRTLKTTAYRLEAGEIVRQRFVDARAFSILAVGLVALGIGLLAAAPQETGEPATPVLVSVTLTAAGQKALNCKQGSLMALRIGGEDTKSSIITLPGPCASVFANFPTSGKAPWGSLTPVEVIEPTN